MGVTPDRHSGVSDEEGTIYEDESIQASQEGEVRYANGAFSLFDAIGEYDPRTRGPFSCSLKELVTDYTVGVLHNCSAHNPCIADGVTLTVSNGSSFVVIG